MLDILKPTKKKGNEKHAVGKYLELIAGDGWADIILQVSDGWRSYIWSLSQQEIWFRLPSAANRYLGLHKTRVGSAKAESTFENGAGSTDLEITTLCSVSLVTIRMEKQWKKADAPSKAVLLVSDPAEQHGCFLPPVRWAPALHPTRYRSISVCWAS